MTIERIESLTFGVEDVDAGIRFFEDWGLGTAERAGAGAVFVTPENQAIHIRRADDGGLPETNEPGSTLREAVWGVDSDDALAALAADLARDREVAEDADGTLHSRDQTGNAIGFCRARRTPVQVDEPRFNLNDAMPRLNRRVAERRAHPIRLGHVVYMIPKEGWEAATDYYVDRLGFRLIDRSLDLGDFMRCEGANDHHSLFLLNAADVARFHHIAFEVRDFDEIMFGGTFMRDKGWTPVTNPGRRILGSNLYWNFANPCGGAIEYFADMDRMDDDWEPRVWENHPGNSMWQMGTLENPGR